MSIESSEDVVVLPGWEDTMLLTLAQVVQEVFEDVAPWDCRDSLAHVVHELSGPKRSLVGVPLPCGEAPILGVDLDGVLGLVESHSR